MMQTLKPRCVACGTENAIDADYCTECGVRLNYKETIAKGMELFLDDIDKSHELYGKPYGDYTLQTKKKNSIDHLRESLSPKTPFPEDKRLDFESNQIPDWEFQKEFIVENDEDIAKHGRIEGRNVLKVKTSNLDEAMKKIDWHVPLMSTAKIEETFKEDFEKWNNDPYYIPFISGKNQLLTTTSNLNPQPPYSAVIGTDVRKGITPIGEPPKKIGPIRDHTITKKPQPRSSIIRRDVQKGIGKPHVLKKDYSQLLWYTPVFLWVLLFMLLYL